LNIPASKKYLALTLAAVIALLFLTGKLSGLLLDWLWFRELAYSGIFIRLLTLKIVPGLLAWLAAFLFLGGNLYRGLKRTGPELLRGQKPGARAFWLRWGPWLLAAVVAIPFMLYFAGKWDVILRRLWSRPIGRSDPIFHHDLSFYLFELPFLEILQNSLTVLAFLAFALVLALVLLSGFARTGGASFSFPPKPMARQLVLTFLLYLTGFAWGFFLDRYALLYSARGAVYGAGYTDLLVVRPGLWAMLAASALLAMTVLYFSWRNRLRLALWCAGVYLILQLAVLLLAPWVVQKFIVEPNELELETPFLEHEIALTREAYGIDRLEVRDYPALSNLTREKVFANDKTLRNIRLWDWRPLLQTFRQLQEIRLYYQFYEVDVDRYLLDGEYRQVMLSARELAPQLPERADTWVNRTLQYTHGYGLVMSLAAQEGEAGTPTLLIRDLPPKVSRGLSLERPAIFYGEKTPGYRIVNTGVPELDYPRGDKNVYIRYAGRGGIPIDAFWKRLLFAWELSDINILLSGYLKPDSRLQLRRQVRERVGHIAPFLLYDSDPYLVLAEGKLYWIQDAYTISDRYPYTEPYRRRLNYIRNSVKVVIDLYQGKVDFYMMQPDEPVLGVYRRAFPGVFRPLEEMPAELHGHLRYPEDLFRIQVAEYNRYHMTIPQVFYNNEDLWTLPREKYAGNPIPMEPYYILMRLPEEKRQEFLLMQPLTPQNRDNMIAWMAARCDEPDYGRLLVYKLPKEKLIFGPMQVEAMIDQDPDISRQLSLWDQRGSQVIRGNLLVIPLDHSFIYVEPVYLIAESNNIPQLRRVIVAYNDHIAMEPTLEQAIAAVFGPTRAKPQAPPVLVPAPGGPEKLQKAREIFNRAQKALQEGNWPEFGRAMGELKEVLGEGSRH
jgi:uncharacterized membrane protein (UPF0182 family)